MTGAIVGVAGIDTAVIPAHAGTSYHFQFITFTQKYRTVIRRTARFLSIP
jgi:hypothetical protein